MGKTGKLLAIFSSVLHNHVTIADLTAFYSTDPSSSGLTLVDDTFDILLHDGEDSSARWDPRGINIRRIRVIPGSNYFWVDAPELDKVFVVKANSRDLSKTKIVQEITGLDTKDIVYVEAHSHKAQHGMMAYENSTIVANGLGVFATILSCIAMVMAIVLCTNTRSGFPRVQKDNETDKDNGSDPEDPSVDLPSFR